MTNKSLCCQECMCHTGPSAWGCGRLVLCYTACIPTTVYPGLHQQQERSAFTCWWPQVKTAKSVRVRCLRAQVLQNSRTQYASTYVLPSSLCPTISMGYPCMCPRRCFFLRVPVEAWPAARWSSLRSVLCPPFALLSTQLAGLKQQHLQQPFKGLIMITSLTLCLRCNGCRCESPCACAHAHQASP